MRFISWNVNGLRALYNQEYWGWLVESGADALCLQEIKAEEEQLVPDVQKPKEYHAYFNSSQERKGYSGVATYTKKEPQEVIYDCLPDEFNTQGRLLQTRFDGFVLLNGYFPNGGGGPEKLAYKLAFYDAFLEHTESLRANGDSLIICGDLNVAHEPIDLARPEANKTHVGFLPEERAWMDEMINLGYIDTFRNFYPNKKDAYTYWDMKTGARDRNVGWRIDYFLVSPDLAPKLEGVVIHTDVYGSDHCPIELKIKL